MAQHDELAAFEGIFDEELESGFSAGIACCDACYDEFIRRWPAVYLRDIEFQRCLIGLDVFYGSSRLHELYTEEEYWRLVSQLECPNCGAKLDGNLWPYIFPFEIPEFFEDNLRAVAETAIATPFLVLTQPFAQAVLGEIKKAGDVTAVKAIGTSYFRARLDRSLKDPQPSDFDKPPPEMTSEGRYNHAGKPVLYLASDPKTCFLELTASKEPIYVAEISLTRSLKILDLTQPEGEHAIVGDVLIALVYSSLVSAPREGEGWNRPEYVFSRFVADCGRAAGFDGIQYPTTRASKGHNLVIINSGWRLTDLGYVVRITLYEDYHARERAV